MCCGSEEGGGAEQGDETLFDGAVGKCPQAAADACAGTERGGEDAARDTGPVGDDGCPQFGRPRAGGFEGDIVQGIGDGVVAGAIGLAVAVCAEGCEQQAEGEGDRERVAA